MLGQEAAEAIAVLDVDTSFFQQTGQFPTGTARVQLGPGDSTRFVIERRAAYDAIRLSDHQIKMLDARASAWFYYGTLFSATLEGKATLVRLLDALPAATRFYDVNLRPGSDSASLVIDLLGMAHVVKLNEEELAQVHAVTGLPVQPEAFCRAAAERYG